MSWTLSQGGTKSFRLHSRVESKRIMLLAILVFPWTAAAAISPKNEGYALIQDPPSVAIVDLRSLKVVTAIPVGLPPKHALAGPDGGFLYVLSQKPASKKGPETDQSEISIIDLGSRKVIKTHPITGKITQFVLTEDKRHLFCFVPGSHEEGKPNVPASILFFDTHTNKVAALFSMERPAGQAMYRKDLKRIFALSAAVSTKASEPRSELRAPAKLTVFQLGESKPVVSIELPDRPTVMGLSSDEKWLYVVDRGYHNHWSIPHLPLSARTVGRWVRKDNEKNHRDGWVRIYDVALLKEVAVHKLGTSPWKLFVDPMTNTVSILGFAEDGIRGKLYEFRDKDMVRSIDTGECPQNVIRVAELPGRLIVSYTDIRFVPDDEKGQPFTLPLNASKLVDRPAASARFLDGWPGEVIYAPQLRRIIIGAISAGAFLLIGEGFFIARGRNVKSLSWTFPSAS